MRKVNIKAKPAPKAIRREPTADWMQTPGTYIAGDSALTECDRVAREVEGRWGVDRARLLVGEELRAKFDRQRYLLNRAVYHGTLDDVRTEARRMASAWRAVDRAATEAGAQPVSPDVWEVALDGKVYALVRTADEAHALAADGRSREVWTLDEVARALQAFTSASAIKRAFPGAAVVAIRAPSDPLRGVPDSNTPLDDVIPF
jgi:hypothetical protein